MAEKEALGKGTGALLKGIKDTAPIKPKYEKEEGGIPAENLEPPQNTLEEAEEEIGEELDLDVPEPHTRAASIKPKGAKKGPQEDPWVTKTFIVRQSTLDRLDAILTAENKRYLNFSEFTRVAVEDLLDYEEKFQKMAAKQLAKVKERLEREIRRR